MIAVGGGGATCESRRRREPFNRVRGYVSPKNFQIRSTANGIFQVIFLTLSLLISEKKKRVGSFRLLGGGRGDPSEHPPCPLVYTTPPDITTLFLMPLKFRSEVKVFEVSYATLLIKLFSTRVMDKILQTNMQHCYMLTLFSCLISEPSENATTKEQPKATSHLIVIFLWRLMEWIKTRQRYRTQNVATKVLME